MFKHARDSVLAQIVHKHNTLGGQGCVQTHQSLGARTVHTSPWVDEVVFKQSLGAPTERSLRVSVLPGVGCSVMLFLLHCINYQHRHKTLPRLPRQLQPTADRAPPGRWDRSRLIHPRGTTHRTAQTRRPARRRRRPIIKVRWLDLNLCGASVYRLCVVPSGAGSVKRGKRGVCVGGCVCGGRVGGGGAKETLTRDL